MASLSTALRLSGVTSEAVGRREAVTTISSRSVARGRAAADGGARERTAAREAGRVPPGAMRRRWNAWSRAGRESIAQVAAGRAIIRHCARRNVAAHAFASIAATSIRSRCTC